MTSVQRNLSGKADRSRVNNNTKRVGQSRWWGDVYYCCDSQWKELLILDRDSFSPVTCVSTLVVKFVVVGGERNPASLPLSFRVRDRELEGNPASLVLSFRVRGREREGKRWITVAQDDGLRMNRGGRAGTLDKYAVKRTGWTSDPASRALPLRVHTGSWTGGEEPRPRRLKDSGWVRYRAGNLDQFGLLCRTQLVTQLPQRRIQVVRSNKVARKRLTEWNSTPAMDPGHVNID